MYCLILIKYSPNNDTKVIDLVLYEKEVSMFDEYFIKILKF